MNNLKDKMETEYKKQFDGYKKVIEDHLGLYIPVQYPNSIFESMRYSVLAGGKRLRPVIALEVAKMLSGNYENAIPVACAIEMLHCQSLIHDDLPCMDNDDFRRGKPTNHKVYGEAIATLAGDALLSFAPQIILKNTKNVSEKNILRLLDEFFIAAGVYGIIAGQVVDIESEKKKIDDKTLDFIHEFKTAKLFIFAVRAGAIVADCDDETLDKLTKFATDLGHAFQIYDDILDEIATLEELGKTPGKDMAVEKSTYTSMYGLESARKQVNFLCVRACDILRNNNFNSIILEGIVNDIIERVYK